VTPPEPAAPGWDPKVLVAVAIVAVVALSPFRAAPGQSPWPAALALTAVFSGVALVGWLVLRRTPPPPEE
jgi:hypothetical protein